MKKVLVIVEKGDDGDLWGRIEGIGLFFPVTVGKDTDEIVANMKDLLADYIVNDGDKDKEWKKVDIEKVKWEFAYDIQAFFDTYDFLTISTLAKYAGINPSLLRQYASGSKYPSDAQVKKIEEAAHLLGKKLQDVALVS